MISSTKVEIASAKEAIKQAYALGQTDQLADLQERLSELSATKLELERAKRNTISEVRRADEITRVAAEKPATTAIKEDPKPLAAPAVETKQTPDEWIGQFPRKTQTWLRDNKDYVTDPSKHKALLEFANEWAADYGQATLHTPSFIEALNEKFSGEASDDGDVTINEDKPERAVERETPKPKAKTMSSAPVSRGGSHFSSKNMDARTVKLPPRLAAEVKAMGLDPTQYALGAVEDIKAGKLPKNFLDPDYDHR